MNDILHTYFEPTPADTSFIFQINGRNAATAGNPGRDLLAFGGDGTVVFASHGP